MDTILLLDDGTLKSVPSSLIRGKFTKDMLKNLYGMLCPVGIYSPQYICVKSSQLLNGFEHARITYRITSYQTHFDHVCNGDYDDNYITIECDNLPEFYRALYNICAMEGFNILYLSSPSVIAETQEISTPMITSLKIKLNTRYGKYEFEHDKTRLRESLSKFANEEFDLLELLPEYDYTRYILDMKKGIWKNEPLKDDPIRKSDDAMISIGLVRYNALTFVNSKDLKLIYKYHRGMLRLAFITLMDQLDNIPTNGKPLTYDFAVDHPMFVNIVYCGEYRLFTPSDIIESVITIRQTIEHAKMALDMMAEAAENIDCIMVDISMYNDKIEPHSRFGDCDKFEYSVLDTLNEPSDVEDYYDNFMEEYMRFLKDNEKL